jgi:hypothetical protein
MDAADNIKNRIMDLCEDDMKIKFSHNYKKLVTGKVEHCGLIENATLIEVINIDLENLSNAFRRYDTDNGKYELPKKGKYMILIFQKTERDIFTTIRRWTPEKEKYYRSAIDQNFEIEVNPL